MCFVGLHCINRRSLPVDDTLILDDSRAECKQLKHRELSLGVFNVQRQTQITFISLTVHLHTTRACSLFGCPCLFRPFDSDLEVEEEEEK